MLLKFPLVTKLFNVKVGEGLVQIWGAYAPSPNVEPRLYFREQCYSKTHSQLFISDVQQTVLGRRVKYDVLSTHNLHRGQLLEQNSPTQHATLFADPGRQHIPTFCRTSCIAASTERTWFHIHMGNRAPDGCQENDRTVSSSTVAFFLACHRWRETPSGQPRGCRQRRCRPWSSRHARQA